MPNVAVSKVDIKEILILEYDMQHRCLRKKRRAEILGVGLRVKLSKQSNGAKNGVGV